MGVQVPLTQAMFGPQAFPQPPQLAGSLFVSTHDAELSPHDVSPEGHSDPQLPATQATPSSHAFPQAPQLAGSVSTSVQGAVALSAHTKRCAPQVVVHTPPAHAEPAAHVFPHVPQLASSVCVFVQVAPHIVEGEVQPAPASAGAVPTTGVLPMQAPIHTSANERLAEMDAQIPKLRLRIFIAFDPVRAKTPPHAIPTRSSGKPWTRAGSPPRLTTPSSPLTTTRGSSAVFPRGSRGLCRRLEEQAHHQKEPHEVERRRDEESGAGDVR